MGASYPAGVTNVYGETLELSTTLASLGLPGKETKQAIIYNPNYDFRLHINPAILEFLIYDATNSAGGRFERSSQGNKSTMTIDLTDRSGDGTDDNLSSTTSSDYVYIRTSDIIGGLHVVMTDYVNNLASALTVNYWDGDEWQDILATDGTTQVGGKSLSGNGNITWDIPTTYPWKPATLGGNVFDSGIKGMSITDTDAPATVGFWLRLNWSSGLGQACEIGSMWTLNRNTNRGYFHGGVEYPISFDARVAGAIEAILESDKIPDGSTTDTMEVTWIRTVI